MKISENWLREWVNPDISTEELAHQLIMSGTELDAIEAVASNFTHVVVGLIKSIEQHPDADRLTVCQVDVGADELIQIVTNAKVKEGQKVPVAMIGAELPEPDGKIFKIKKSKLRGVLSQGMFCGAETLGMGEAGEGLLEIPDEAVLGADLRAVLKLDDVVLDLDTTPNRGDLLSHAGVAREVGVITGTEVTEPEIRPVQATLSDILTIKISAADLCQRYTGRVIRDVDVNAGTPYWMKEKLRRVGIRSLGPVVDVTNYVMMELGQPMHGFDLDALDGGITVRQAQQGEKLTLLDGKEISLRADTLVIADDKKALALAGIMGGEQSAVTEATENIYLESAYFVPEKIMGKARSYGLHTDSSHRFERGVSPDLQLKALERATQLILDICGGQAGPVSDVSTNDKLHQRDEIFYARGRTRRHLGVDVADERIEDILVRLGCEVNASASDDGSEDGWRITPPVFRFDLSMPEDIVEEIARIYGYDNIPAVLRPMEPRIVLKPETEVREEDLQNLLLARGYREAITYSFVPPEVESLLSGGAEQIRLTNPISEELSVMRRTLWSGLIPALDKNVKRQQQRVRLFETGLTFVKTGDGLPEQRKKLAGVITGPLYDEQWSADARMVDFYDVKGDVEALLDEASAQTFEFKTAEHAALHPGQSAEIICEGRTVGFCGALHPAVEKKLDLDQAVFVFELDLDLMMQKKMPHYSRVSPYPSIRRDLALLLDKNTKYANIANCLTEMNMDQLVDFMIFDVYSGEKLDSGQKSIALGLIFQDFSRTLEEQEINGYVEKIMARLTSETGAVLR